MKIIAIVFSLLIVLDSFGQDCWTRAKSKSEPWIPSVDQFMNIGPKKPVSWDITKMKPNNVKALSWIKNLLTGFTGAKVGYTDEYSLDYINGGGYVNNFYKATGIKGYYGSTTRFWDYYCYDKTANVANPDKVETNGEAGSFIYINFNNVFVTDLTRDVGAATINGKLAFTILEKSHSEGRVDFYDLRAKNTVNDTIYTSKRDIIIIRNSDKPVFIPITRKEYLQQMLKDVEISRASRKEIHTRSYNDMAKAHEEEIKRYKLDKNFTPEKEAIRRKWFAEDQAKLDKLIKKIDPDSDAALEVINQYLQKPGEWLNRSVRSFYPYPDSYSAMNVTHYFENLDNFKESKEDYTRRELVSINPDYFNKTLRNDVPQLMMVELVKASFWYMYILEKKVKQPGGLKALVDIVNPGKSAPTEAVPPVVTPTYTLSYLPKLTKLTPLKRPAGMKPSTFPVVPNYTGGGAGTKLNFEIPAKSPKLSQMPQLLTEESYKAYIQQLNTAISNAIKPDQKRKADEYIKNKKLTQSKDISNSALAAWLQKAPRASLYLYSKAVITNPSDVLAANNFSAFLMMGGLPEKSIPILEYWNKQKPGEATILSNLGNAYYRLGDVEKAMKYLQQCVQRDSLNATANKILCLLYLKKGDTKKAEEHGTKSITTSHDQQVISVLQQLNKKIRPGEIMSREHKKEFPLLKRIRLPVMPSSIDQMDEFKSNLEAEKASLEMTMQSIYAKMGTQSGTVKQKVPVAVLAGGVASIRMKAQSIVLDAMQNYTNERAEEYEVFHYQLETMTNLYETKVSDIMKTYDKQLKNLKSGEGGDEDEILRLEMARCKEIYAVTNDYVAALAPSFNQYAQRQEYIARKYYRDIANWAPYWMPQEPNWFRSIQKDYLEDISRILREYRIIKRSKCAEMEGATPEAKRIKLKEFEDEYCANMKGKLGLVGGGISWTCNSWSVEAGEGLLLELEMNYSDDGSFESFVLGGGLGAGLDLGGGNVIGLEAGASVKEFIKVGFNEATGKVEVKDFGVKAEATVEGSIGPVGNEIKILELTAAVNAGFEAGGVLAPVLHLK